MADLIRDAPLGQFLRRITGNSILLHPEERPDFDYSSVSLKSENGDSSNSSEQPYTTVTWYSDDDKANPQNWSLGKKCFVHSLLCLLTFSIYSGSSIVTPAQPILREKWGVSAQESLLILSMYVLGYGTGPLFFSPLSEIPALGRSFPYVVSYSLFLILSIPAALVDNYPGLVVLRFLQGFFGGPVLATGGASAADMFSFPKLPYAMSIWVFAAYGGPALGPILSVYTVERLSWRWVMYEILIIGGVTGILLVCFLPETNPEKILLERVKRLRKVTGRSDLRSASEQKTIELKVLPLLARYLWTPFKVPLEDPAILFTDVYTALVYGIYYSFFESFPVAYGGVYGFSPESMSLVFIALLISCGISVVIYVSLVWFIYEPYTMSNGIGIPEYRLVPGVYAAALVPFSLFLFGWATRPEINWAVPSIGLLIFPGCAFVLIQVILLYLPTSYPRYAASILAGNTFLRSATACAAVHFSQPLFQNLGVGRGNSVLGGICVGCFFCFLGLWYFGPKLRAKSKFADA